MAKVIVVGNLAESLIAFRGRLLEEMVLKGHEVYACVPFYTEAIKNSVVAMGVKPLEVNFDRVGLNPFKDIKRMGRLIGIFKKIKPDVVLFYTIKPVVYGSIFSVLTKVPNVSSMITGLGSLFIGQDKKTKLLRKVVIQMYRAALKCNDLIFFQNQDDLNLFRELRIIKENKRTVVINGSGVDTRYFAQKDFPEELSFLMIARLISDKGIREYVEAARMLKKKDIQAKFYLVGILDGNPSAIKKAELEGWIKEGTIEFLGTLEDVRPAIANSCVYVLPSYREGTPRTVLEAMAMGRPIISTDAPGCRETVVEGVNGYLVPVKDVCALAAAMEKFILNPPLISHMGAASRKIAEEKYEVSKVNRVIMENLGLLPKKSLVGESGSPIPSPTHLCR